MAKGKAKVSKKRPDSKKSCNAFFLYKQSVQDLIKTQLNISNQAQVNLIAGKWWKSLSIEDKQPYIMEAYRQRSEMQDEIDATAKIPVSFIGYHNNIENLVPMKAAIIPQPHILSLDHILNAEKEDSNEYTKKAPNLKLNTNIQTEPVTLFSASVKRLSNGLDSLFTFKTGWTPNTATVTDNVFKALFQ